MVIPNLVVVVVVYYKVKEFQEILIEPRDRLPMGIIKSHKLLVLEKSAFFRKNKYFSTFNCAISNDTVH